MKSDVRIFNQSLQNYFNIDTKINKSKETFIYPSVLVLSGGGMKGISYVGAIRALRDLKILSHVTTFAGTSIGALMCALLVLGYTSQELEQFSLNFQFELLQKINFDNFLDSFGVDNGDNVDIVIKTLIRHKIGYDDITLLDLYKKTKKTFIAITTCIDDETSCSLSHETEPFMPLYLALKMSMCIPIFYVPIKYRGKYYVDGGCTLNYPITLFDNKLQELIGIYVINEDNSKAIVNFENYISKLLLAIMSNDGKRILKQYEKNTIIIPISGITSTNYQLTQQKKKELCDIGYTTVMNKYTINV